MQLKGLSIFTVTLISTLIIIQQSEMQRKLEYLHWQLRQHRAHGLAITRLQSVRSMSEQH